MAHNLNMIEGQAAMAYAASEGKPWHGLGTAVPGLMTASQALVAARLDWTAEKVPALSSFDLRPIPGAHAVIRKDNGNPIGLVGDRYTVVQNADAASLFDDIFGKLSAQVDTAGALGAGEKVWMMAKLPSSFEVRNGDRVDQYMLVSNSHDGTSPLRVLFTGVRVVCQNTLSAALRGNKGFVTIRHCRGAEAKMQAAVKTLQAQAAYWASLKDYCEKLASYNVDSVEVGSFMEAMFPTKKLVVDDNGVESMEEKKRKNTKNRDTVQALFDGAQKGADMAGSTAWGLLNAYTEWLDHHRISRAEGAWAYSVMGKGQEDRQGAFDKVCEIAGVK